MLNPMISNLNIKPRGISQDSRTVKAGDLFFALIPDYIPDAINKKACAIIADQTRCHHVLNATQAPIPIIFVEHLKQKLGEYAAEFYRHPSKHLKIIGVTGTNGKTSCTHFLAQIFQQSGFKSGVIGTLGNGEINHLHHSIYTTPDAISLQQCLLDFYKKNIRFVALEASSQGLAQGRLNGTLIETALFTNLTQDHLDYHGSLENYAKAKYLLFQHPGLKNAVFNLDDPLGFEWADHFSKQSDLKVYGISTKEIFTSFPVIYAKDIQTHPEGFTATVTTPKGQGVLTSKLWGKFNLSNLLGVLSILLIYDFPLDRALEALSQLTNVTGRMQLFKKAQKPLVIVDYAHTPDALQKTLETIREHSAVGAKLWCIFGAGGDRDADKRPKMGRIAEYYADEIILTNDNPRNENPLDIIAQIRSGFINPQNSAIIELSREKAIAHALTCAKPEDIILVAGKGHEDTQEICGEKFPYSDILTVKLLLLE